MAGAPEALAGYFMLITLRSTASACSKRSANSTWRASWRGGRQQPIDRLISHHGTGSRLRIRITRRLRGGRNCSNVLGCPINPAWESNQTRENDTNLLIVTPRPYHHRRLPVEISLAPEVQRSLSRSLGALQD